MYNFIYTTLTARCKFGRIAAAHGYSSERIALERIANGASWLISIANCVIDDLRLIRIESFLPPLVVRVVLAPRHPLPHLGQPLRELGGEERVGVDGGQLREERLVVGHEPGKERQSSYWLLQHIETGYIRNNDIFSASPISLPYNRYDRIQQHSKQVFCCILVSLYPICHVLYVEFSFKVSRTSTGAATDPDS